MIAFLTNRVTLALIGAVVGVGVFAFTHYTAYQSGYEAARADALARSVEVLRERTETDDEIRSMDDSALCSALGGVWSDDKCQ